MASLNTSDWSSDAAAEMQLSTLRDYLGRPGFVGLKLAPPHTCLRMDGPKMEAVINAVNQSTATAAAPAASPAALPAVFIHTGTTPFCPGGMFGENTGACCSDEYVNVARLEPLITLYSRLPWVLLHSGYDFTPSHRTDITEQALDLASTHANVYLEVSAMFATVGLYKLNAIEP